MNKNQGRKKSKHPHLLRKKPFVHERSFSNGTILIASTARETPLTFWLTAAIPAVIAFLVHIPALWGGWVWDDFIIVHSQLRAFRSITDLFFPPEGIINFSMHYYRPLTVASYLLDRLIYGEQAFGFHLTVLLAHSATALLLFLLARTFLPPGRAGTLAALYAALLFSTHPIHAESVGWIAGRADVLAAVPLFAAALLLRCVTPTITSICIVSLLFAAACLFKEVAYGFIPIAALFIKGANRSQTRLISSASELRTPTSSKNPHSEAKVARGRYRRSLLFLLGSLALVAFALLILRAAALGDLGADVPRNVGFEAMLQGLGGAFAFYLPRVMIPLPPRPFADSLPGVSASWSGLAAAFVLIVFSFYLLRRSRQHLIAIGIISFIALLAPSLVPAVLQISIVPIAERYLYIPTAALLLSAAGLIAAVPTSARRVLNITLIGILIAAGMLSITRTRIWGDEVVLWRTAVATSSSPSAMIELATALDDRGNIMEAEEIYSQMLSDSEGLSDEDRALVKTNLGIMFRSQGRKIAALQEFEEAVQLNPKIASAWFGLATCLLDGAARDPATGRINDKLLLRIEESILQAAALSPFDPEILLFLGRVEGALGRFANARSALSRAVAIDPEGEAGREARLLLSRME